jgi:GNAT superfamily N-acetyltransferase
MTAEVRVRAAEGRRDRGRFVDLPVRLHRGAPGFVAPLRVAELHTVDPARNPFFRHGTIDLFLAERDGVPVGRVAYVDNPRHERLHGENIGFFGFFEASDARVAEALLEVVEDAARRYGRAALRGPVSPTMNDSAGIQLDAFDRPPFLMMPWNPPSYPGWIEAAGYAKVKDLLALMVTREQGLPDRVSRLAARARQRSGVEIREVRPADWDRELAAVQRIYREAWERNWGEVPYADDEFADLAATLKLVVDPRIALLAELDGEPIGVALGLPDLNQVLARFDGRIVPFGLVPLLRRRALIDQIRLAILGVLPAHRRHGIELVLIDEVWRRGEAAGYRRAEMSWILEDNEAILKAIRAIGGEVYKRYRLYQKAV